MRKRLGIFVALLMLATPLLALGHMALVPHYFNFATGALEHARCEAGDAAGLAPGMSADSRETCGTFAVFLSQSQLWTIALAVVAVFLVVRAANPLLPPSASRDHKLTLALAPKNSPPVSF